MGATWREACLTLNTKYLRYWTVSTFLFHHVHSPWSNALDLSRGFDFHGAMFAHAQGKFVRQEWSGEGSIWAPSSFFVGPHRRRSGQWARRTRTYFSRSVGSSTAAHALLLSAFIFVMNQILSRGESFSAKGGTCSFKSHVCAPLCKLVATARDSCSRTCYLLFTTSSPNRML